MHVVPMKCSAHVQHSRSQYHSLCLSQFTWAHANLRPLRPWWLCSLAPLPSQISQVPSFAVGLASPCAWNVCVTRKAPLVASDSSSSGGSDSEDDEKAAGSVEAVCTGHGGKPSPLPRTEEAAAGRCEGNGELAGGPVNTVRLRS